MTQLPSSRFVPQRGAPKKKEEKEGELIDPSTFSQQAGLPLRLSPSSNVVNNLRSNRDDKEIVECDLAFYHRAEGMKASQRLDHMIASYHYEAAADEQAKFVLLAAPHRRARSGRYRLAIILYTSAYKAYLGAGGVKGDDRCKSLIRKQKAVVS